MGRKIPAKKHRGVKDPLLQQARRFESIKNKINQPPKDPDDQPVPKSLSRLFGGSSVLDRGAVRRCQSRKGSRKFVGVAVRPSAREPLALSRLQRLPGESARSFSHRITGAVRALHQDTPLQYPQETEEEEPEHENRRKKKKSGADEGKTRETRAQRRKLKKQLKIQNSVKEKVADKQSEVQYERVAFGVTVHAPPALSLPPRNRVVNAAGAGPGARRGLLLAGAGAGAAAAAAAADEAERRRLAAVAAYRALKASRAARAALKL